MFMNTLIGVSIRLTLPLRNLLIVDTRLDTSIHLLNGFGTFESLICVLWANLRLTESS